MIHINGMLPAPIYLLHANRYQYSKCKMATPEQEK